MDKKFGISSPMKYFLIIIGMATLMYGALIYQMSVVLLSEPDRILVRIGSSALFFLAIFIVFISLAIHLARRMYSIYITTQKEFEESEKRYRRYFESSVDGFVQTSLDGVVQLVSPSVERLSGWKPEDMIGRPVTDFYGYVNNRSQLVETVVGQNMVANFRSTALGAEGQMRVTSVNSALACDETGQPTGIMSWIRDITEQYMIEKELAESQQLMTQIIDFLPDATFAADMDGKVLIWNRAMEDMTSIKAADILGHHYHDFTNLVFGPDHPVLMDYIFDPATDVSKTYDNVQTYDHVVAAEVTTATPSGQKTQLSGKAVPLYDASHKIIAGIQSIRDITDRKHAEDKFNLAFHSNGTAMAITQAGTGIFLEVNNAMQNHTGFSREEMIDQTPAELGLYSQETMDELRENFIKSNPIRNHEVLVTAKDGSQKNLLFNSDYIHLGNQLCILTSIFDITWNKQAEELLRQNELKFRELTENITDLLCSCTLDLEFTYINPPVYKILGYTQEESYALGGSGLLTQQSLQDVQDRLASVLEQEKQGLTEQDVSTTLELECRHKDGSLRYLHAIISPLRNEQGHLSSLLAIGRDITNRRQAEQDLKETKQRLADIIDFLPDPTMVIDMDGKVITWNQAAEELTGVKSADIIGRDYSYYSTLFYNTQRHLLIDYLLTPDGIPEYMAFERVGETFIAENFCPAIGPKGAYIRAHASLLYDSEGRVTGAIETFRDATQEKEAQERNRFLSFHDPLTGLYNRAYFDEEMRRIYAGRLFYGVMVFDVDGLKLINDTFGHRTGDKLLASAAHLIRDSLRESELIARIGGDEFTALIPNADSLVMESIALRVKINENHYNKYHPEIPLSISVGYASADDIEADIYDLYRLADNMMYREKLRHKQSSRNLIVRTLLTSLEVKEVISKEHASRMQELSVALACKVNLGRQQVNDVILLAQFHDIGKVGVADSILLKPGPLTTEEKKEMQRHCEIGSNIALASPDLAPIADGILKHREWWDGSGYPLGIQGENIPVTSRIVSIINAYNAMTTDKPYRKAMSHDEAVAEIEQCAGKQFDPQLVSAFLEIITMEKQDRMN